MPAGSWVTASVIERNASFLVIYIFFIHIVQLVDILNPGETVIVALKRLKPTPKPRVSNQQKRRKMEEKSAAQSTTPAAPGQKRAAEDLTPEEKLRKEQFELVTESADLLLGLGYVGVCVCLFVHEWAFVSRARRFKVALACRCV